jgi:hypothetical protein
VNNSWKKWLPVAFVAVAALSRWPGLFPLNFSGFYALAFCAGVFFPGKVKWWLPMGTLLATDLALNLYYTFALHINAFQPFQLINYFAFALLILLGSKFSRASSFVKLLSGGILGALLFYLITNTAAWLFNPFGNVEYTKDLAGWLIALTKGTSGHPTTLEFLRNTLLSGGLFTGLFVGAAKFSEAAESAREKQTDEETVPEPDGEPEPEESRA